MTKMVMKSSMTDVLTVYNINTSLHSGWPLQTHSALVAKKTVNMDFIQHLPIFRS